MEAGSSTRDSRRHSNCHHPVHPIHAGPFPVVGRAPRQREVRRFFPDAVIDDYEHIISRLTTDPKDRHVLAAAVRAGSSLPVTFNLKDFPSASLQEWKVEATHAQDDLLVLDELDPTQVVQRVAKIAGQRDETHFDTLVQLGKSCPAFAARLIDDLELS